MISKSLFCSTIESIIIQILKDREIGSYFVINSGSSLNGTCTYDNSAVIKSCVILLQEYFPKDEDGYCAIEEYLFVIEFKNNEKDLEYQTPEELYKELIKKL